MWRCPTRKLLLLWVVYVWWTELKIGGEVKKCVTRKSVLTTCEPWVLVSGWLHHISHLRCIRRNKSIFKKTISSLFIFFTYLNCPSVLNLQGKSKSHWWSRRVCTIHNSWSSYVTPCFNENIRARFLKGRLAIIQDLNFVPFLSFTLLWIS